jgi:hypothetical protein
MRRKKLFNLLRAIRGSQLDAVRPCGQPERIIAANVHSRTLGTIAPTMQKVKMRLVIIAAEMSMRVTAKPAGRARRCL